jgi:non-ribosomal peptide synthetase component E (peptide arylation enzyme)
LRLWVCAGAPIPAAVVERANATLPNIKVLSLYGRSENLVTTTCSVDDDVSRALTSDGSAVPGAEVKVVDIEGNEVPRGTEGDIAYRGPAHMIEYLANPEETAALFTVDGLSKSGDLGVMTDDGYVRVTGRTKDIVIRGGMNISVREIEDNLVDHPNLLASSCVGMPDERLGERVCCYVVTAAGHTTPSVEDLRKFLLSHGMPIQKIPERVISVDALPMTATGKVLKQELRKDIEGRLNAEAGHAHEVASPR